MKKNEKNTTDAGKSNRMPLTFTNYKLMLIGFAVIVLGFILMSGGGSDDPNVFNEDMFSFRRITLAPLLVLGGFVTAFVSGFIACRWMIGIVKRGKLIYFAVYCLLVGAASIVYSLV